MDNGLLAIGLLALAAALIIAEVFIPSGGMLAIGMCLSLVASFYFAWSTWWQSNPTMFMGFVAFAVLLLPSALIVALAILPRTRFGKRILLDAPTEAQTRPFAAEEERLKSFIGRHARTITPLNPGGLITLDRERLHAFSQGVAIESDTVVEIVRVSGTRVVVQEVTEPEPEPQKNEPQDLDVSNDSEADDEDNSTNPLDFDLPEPK